MIIVSFLCLFLICGSFVIDKIATVYYNGKNFFFEKEIKNMSDFSIALELLGVGMITVFIILALVVILGNLIIRVANYIMPEKQVVATVTDTSSTENLNPKKVAAIVSAVKIITQGRGTVTKIEKM